MHELATFQKAVDGVGEKLSDSIVKAEEKAAQRREEKQVREVVRYVIRPGQRWCPVGVTRGMKRQVYDVPSADWTTRDDRRQGYDNKSMVLTN